MSPASLASTDAHGRLEELTRAALARADVERRWSLEDLPWHRVTKRPSAGLVLAVETFFAIESGLPDYVSVGLTLLRAAPAAARYVPSWAAEKVRHHQALGDWLVASGARDRAALASLEARVLEAPWRPPFSVDGARTPLGGARRMLFFALLQELATFLTYARHREAAMREGDECLRSIFDFLARDENAHAKFFERATHALLGENREAALEDLAEVLATFESPGAGSLPDYDERLAHVRETGVDRDMFIQRIYLPVMKRLGVSRQELAAARVRAREARALSTQLSGARRAGRDGAQPAVWSAS
ncbi:MAG: acyl-ACP desaturase [Polyangiaceae bacterium]